MFENPDVILRTVSKMLFRYGDFDFAKFAPAHIESAARRIPLADIVSFATQFGLIVSLVFVAIIVYVALQRRDLVTKTQTPAESVQADVSAVPPAVSGALAERWREIMGHLDSARENDWKLAVVEADKLTDTALKQAGFAGD